MKNNNLLYNLFYKLFKNSKKTNYVYAEEIDYIIENKKEKTSNNINTKIRSMLNNKISLQNDNRNIQELEENINYLKNNLDKLLTKRTLLKELLELDKNKEKRKKQINNSKVLAAIISLIGVISLIISALNGTLIFNNILIGKVIITLTALFLPTITTVSFAKNYRRMLNTLKKRIKALNDEDLNNDILNNNQELNKQIGITNNGINKTINMICNDKCLIRVNSTNENENNDKNENNTKEKHGEFEYIKGPYKFVDDDFINICIKRKK